MKLNKLLSIVVAGSIMVTSVVHINSTTLCAEDKEKRDYIIITESEQKMHEIKADYQEDIHLDYEEYRSSEDCMVGVLLTNKEARMLDREKGVIVEEDVEVTGCTTLKENEDNRQ